MTSPAHAGERVWSTAEQFLPEDELLAEARHQADLLGGTPPTVAAGAALRLLAAATGARSVVEVGTGTGVASLWLLRGMHPEGVLTSVDLEPEQQRIARELLAAAGFSGGRVRMISDYPLSVLPRLADGGYDLVYLDVLATAGTAELPAYLSEGVRLLRPGGILVIDKVPDDAMPRDEDSPARDAHSQAVRELCDTVREDESLIPAMLPVGEGLLCAVRR